MVLNEITLKENKNLIEFPKEKTSPRYTVNKSFAFQVADKKFGNTYFKRCTNIQYQKSMLCKMNQININEEIYLINSFNFTPQIMNIQYIFSNQMKFQWANTKNKLLLENL